jgi:hypothetical protein
MVPNNIAFKITNQILKIKEGKNFFALDKNSFYFEPLYFHVMDVYEKEENINNLKPPIKFGMYAFTSNAKLLQEPKKKIVFSPDSVTYQIYGIRTDTMFYLNELCKKNASTFEKLCINSSNVNSPVSLQFLKEMDTYISTYSQY